MSDVVEQATVEAKARPPVKAFAVTEHDESTGGIIFARHSITARKIGAIEYGSGDLSSVKCIRAPWADEWAARDEDVPAWVCISHGWHFECTGCGQTIDEYYLDEKRLPITGVIGTQSSPVFCCTSHKKAFEQEQAAHERAKTRAIAMLQRMVRRRFPGVEFVTSGLRQHAYCPKYGRHRLTQQVIVSFAFPGAKYGPAELRYDTGSLPWKQQGPVQPEFSCCNGDLDAFRAFADATEPKDFRP